MGECIELLLHFLHNFAVFSSLASPCFLAFIYTFSALLLQLFRVSKCDRIYGFKREAAEPKGLGSPNLHQEQHSFGRAADTLLCSLDPSSFSSSS